METITKGVIAETLRKVSEASTNQARLWMDEICEKQPSLEVYLFSADEHFSASDERGIIFMLGFLAWLAHVQCIPLKLVTDAELGGAQEANVRLFYELQASSQFNFYSCADQIIKQHKQRPLLFLVLDTLMSCKEESDKMADANLRLAFLHLKTVIDCLDQ
jgi:hypothetical protein